MSAPRAVSVSAKWTLLTGLVLAFVLVPWVIWGTSIELWVTRVIVHHEPLPYMAFWVIGLLAADVFLPIPSSVVAVAAGVFLGFTGGAIASFLGLMLGCLLGYAFGFKWGPPTARKIVGVEEWDRAAQWAQRFGVGLVLFSRPVPVLAEACTLYAGACRVPVVRYLMACSLGNAVVAAAYASVGRLSAESGDLEPALMAGFLLPGAVMLVVRLLTRKKVGE